MRDSMVLFLIFWICFKAVFLYHVTEGRRCKTPDGDTCCTHFYGNPRKECIECDIGYTSQNGSVCFKCPQPYYGFHCAHKCSCYDNEICNHKIGCKNEKYKGSSRNVKEKVTISHTLPKDKAQIPELQTLALDIGRCGVSANETTLHPNNNLKNCPIGTFYDAGQTCKECPIGFYGKNCFAECMCRDNERCDNKHGCVESTTTYYFSTISKGKEEEERVVFYFGGVGLLVIGFLIGMLLGLKHKCYYQKRASEEKVEEIIQSQAGEPIEMDSYEYIDEQNMTDQNQFTDSPSLPALRKCVQHVHNEASHNDYTYSMDGQKGNRIEDKGVLNTYEPIHRENIYRREYKAIGGAIKTNKQADAFLHPYNSLLKNGFSEGHEYKDLSNKISKPELNSSEGNDCQSFV